METPDQLKIKPYKDYCLAWIAVCACLYIVVCIVGLIISRFQPQFPIPWLGMGIGLIAFTVGVSLITGIGRLCYRDRLIVTKDEIIKLHASKEHFRIKKSDILCIGYRKVNPFAKLLTLFGALMADTCTDAISIRFYKADVYKPFKLINTVEMMHSLSEEELAEGMEEYVESITYKQALQISKLLDVPMKEVVF